MNSARCVDKIIPLRELLEGVLTLRDDQDAEITGLESDSRRLKPGDLFVALKGVEGHGIRFLDQARRAGCAAVIYDPEGAELGALDSASGLHVLPVNGLLGKVGEIADRFYGWSPSEMGLIAVTGTNGKTSCTHFLAEALGRDQPAGVIGTLGWGVPPELSPTQNTTPGLIELRRILRDMARQGCRWVALEASSHGLAQGRMAGLRFEGALFTNFSRDHLDYHETMDAYLESKLLLAEWPALRFIVFHVGEAFEGPIIERAHPDVRIIGVAAEDLECDLSFPVLRYGEAEFDAEGMSFRVRFGGATAQVRVPLFGEFNVENVAGTLGVLIGLGYSLEDSVARVSSLRPIPGRMQRVDCASRQVIVDYAHTPDALENSLKAARHHTQGELWVIFGCGGNRDRGKRHEMGRVAARFADHLVLTDDNPRDEDGQLIIQEILLGVGSKPATVMRDRRQAIRHAISMIGPEDLLLVAGKGHETTQEVAGVKYPFNDREVIEESCRQLAAPSGSLTVKGSPVSHGGAACC